MKRTRRIALLTTVALLGIAGCGDDDDDTGTGTGDDQEEAGGEADLAAYCDASAEIEIASNTDPGVDFETATEEEIADAVRDFAADLQPIADRLQETAPDEVRDAIETQAAALDEVAETGDFAPFEEPDVEAASEEAHAFDLSSCDWGTQDVTAVDYEYEGLDTEVPAGITSIDLANDGTELHELVLIRKNDDTTETFEQLLELPEEEAMAKTTVAGAVFAEPDGEDYSVFDLEPGEYLAICFIPVGTTGEDVQAEGPPHFTQGMFQELTVS